ncbi:MAG: Lrp/AsnC family transcriptional regulator [Paracoccaceae bacterium]|jgi:Lrp/AsnC family leucine-responsive transcriptional regulator
MKLDEFDYKIIRLLIQDARQTHLEISDKIGLSPSPCARRIRKLEDAGLITGYTAKIDESMLGFDFTVFVSIKLDRQIDENLVDFEKNILRYPEVLDCWLMTGTYDYLLRVAVRDLNEFEHFLTGRLTKVSGVASIESSIPIRQVKSAAARIN